MRIAFAIPLCLAVALYGQSSTYIINTAAGSGWIGDGGPAMLSILRQPGGVAADNRGNVYIAETGGHRVRKLDRSGVITTVAGTGVAGFSGDSGPAAQAQLASPYGLAADMLGNLYIADLGNARVRRVAADGTISTAAGGGTLAPGPANEGMPGTSMQLAAPRNVLAADDGSLYISDFGGHRVFQLSTGGLLTTIAGTGTQGYSGDQGLATAARVAFPAGLATGFDGSLYLADSLNHAIRKISSSVITTFASVGTPVGMAFDLFATLFVADVDAQALLRFPANGTLPSLKLPASDVARAMDLSLYVPESAAGIVQKLPVIGDMALAAGGGDPARGDAGAATDALLNHPSGVAPDASGNIYIADRDNGRVRRVALDGTITTVTPPGASWSTPSGISVDAAGNVYVVDTALKKVFRLTPAGVVQPIGPNLALTSPATAVADSAGNVYIADTGAGKIFSVAPAGGVSMVLDKLAGPHGLALDGVGHLFFTEQDGSRVRSLDLASGALRELGAGAWSLPRGIAVSPAGEVFVADTGRQQIMRVDTAGQVAVVAGLPTSGFSGDGASASGGQLNFPWDVAIGPGGILYVADLENYRIRSLTPQTAAGPGVLQVLNAVSLAPGPIAPGMLLDVRGTGVPTVDAASTIILINSIPVPILAMDDTQIQVQAPFDLVTSDSAEIVIVDQGSIVATVSVPTAASAPALYPVDPKAAPVAPGAVVSLYGTGLGLGDLPVTATIAGVPADVVVLDPSPGFTGLFQVTLRVPSAAVPGTASVVVTVGSAASRAGVNIKVD